MIETPEKTVHTYPIQSTGRRTHSGDFNREIYLKMVIEIEKAVSDIRARYIREYGKNTVNPFPSLFDVAESEDSKE